MPLFQLAYYLPYDDQDMEFDEETGEHYDYRGGIYGHDEYPEVIKVEAENMDAAKTLAGQQLKEKFGCIPNLSFHANRAYLDEVNGKAILKAAATKTPKLRQLDLNLMVVINNYGATHPEIKPYNDKHYLVKLGGKYKAGTFSEMSGNRGLKFSDMYGDLHKPGINCSELEGIWEIIEE